jgi:hypothetical protein
MYWKCIEGVPLVHEKPTICIQKQLDHTMRQFSNTTANKVCMSRTKPIERNLGDDMRFIMACSIEILD